MSGLSGGSFGSICAAVCRGMPSRVGCARAFVAQHSEKGPVGPIGQRKGCFEEAGGKEAAALLIGPA